MVLAFCVLWLTFFLTWFIYYLVSTARQLHKAAQVIKDQADELAGVLKKIRLAIELPSSIISLLIEGFKKIAELGVDTFGKDKSDRKKTKKKNGLDKTKKDEAEGTIL